MQEMEAPAKKAVHKKPAAKKAVPKKPAAKKASFASAIGLEEGYPRAMFANILHGKIGKDVDVKEIWRENFSRKFPLSKMPQIISFVSAKIEGTKDYDIAVTRYQKRGQTARLFKI